MKCDSVHPEHGRCDRDRGHLGRHSRWLDGGYQVRWLLSLPGAPDAPIQPPVATETLRAGLTAEVRIFTEVLEAARGSREDASRIGDRVDYERLTGKITTLEHVIDRLNALLAGERL